jgi:hypothetical protein
LEKKQLKVTEIKGEKAKLEERTKQERDELET